MLLKAENSTRTGSAHFLFPAAWSKCLIGESFRISEKVHFADYLNVNSMPPSCWRGAIS